MLAVTCWALVSCDTCQGLLRAGHRAAVAVRYQHPAPHTALQRLLLLPRRWDGAFLEKSGFLLTGCISLRSRHTVSQMFDGSCRTHSVSHRAGEGRTSGCGGTWRLCLGLGMRVVGRGRCPSWFGQSGPAAENPNCSLSPGPSL